MIIARRALLKNVVASFLTTLPLSQVGCRNDPSATRDAQARTSAVPDVYGSYMPPGNLESARLIAQRYLAIVAPSASTDDLRALVRPTVALATRDPDVAESVSALRAQVTADFAAGDSVNIDGWHLARTELQLCVLATMPEVATPA